MDAQPPPENPSNPQFNDDRAPPMVSGSAPLDSETSSLSSVRKDAASLRIGVECSVGTAPSQPSDLMEVLSSDLDRSPSILEPGLRRDHDGCTNAGGHPASSMPCGADAAPDGRPPSDCHATEAIRMGGPPSFDTQISVVRSHANGSTPGSVSVRDTECDFSEARGAELSRSAPLSTREHPIDHSQAGPAFPSPLESARPNSTLPCRVAMDPNSTPSNAVSAPSGSENILLPWPPPEVDALLKAQSFGRVVSPLLARNSPLVPWELPSEIGYFWLGLFRISVVKVIFISANSVRNAVSIYPGYLVFDQVEKRLRRSATSKALTMHCSWRFFLEWVPGGEDQLRDTEKGDDEEWTTHFLPPWWEPEHPQQPGQHPWFRPSRSSASPMPAPWYGITIPGPSPGYSPLLLPLALLAPFSETTTAAGKFPAGFYCTACGRVNVQRFLRHRICEGAACSSRTNTQRETGWAVSAFSTRDRKVNSATVVPDDNWAAPTTAEPATAFDDGARLFHYHLAVGDSSLSAAPSNLGPSDAGAGAHSVRHVFTGNREWLQGDASELFETLQRDVLIERSIGASVFATPQVEWDDPVPGSNRRRIWNQQASFIENAMRTYCRDLGPLKVQALRVYAWISDGKVRMSPLCFAGVAHG